MTTGRALRDCLLAFDPGSAFVVAGPSGVLLQVVLEGADVWLTDGGTLTAAAAREGLPPFEDSAAEALAAEHGCVWLCGRPDEPDERRLARPVYLDESASKAVNEALGGVRALLALAQIGHGVPMAADGRKVS